MEAEDVVRKKYDQSFCLLQLRSCRVYISCYISQVEVVADAEVVSEEDGVAAAAVSAEVIGIVQVAAT